MCTSKAQRRWGSAAPLLLVRAFVGPQSLMHWVIALISVRRAM
jgi:hypothetical protein